MSFLRHIFHQGPVLQSLATSALLSILPSSRTMPALPGAWFEEILPPRPKALIDDSIRWAGGDPSSSRGVLPPYLFPQWAFPLVAKALQTTPFPLTKILNAGCSIHPHLPLPSDQPLHLRTRLLAAEETPKALRFTVEIETSTPSAPRALQAFLQTSIPLPKPASQASGYPASSASSPSSGSPASAKEGPAKEASSSRPSASKRPEIRIPTQAHEIRYLRLPATAGLDFAALTGDFNPIHWLPAYAKMAGFRRCILHGFGSLAILWESVSRAYLSGDPRRLASFEIRFLRPILLPASLGVYLTPDTELSKGLFLGDAPGALAAAQGRFVMQPSGAATPEAQENPR